MNPSMDHQNLQDEDQDLQATDEATPKLLLHDDIWFMIFEELYQLSKISLSKEMPRRLWSQLWSLRLVSRHFEEMVTPFAYRHVSFKHHFSTYSLHSHIVFQEMLQRMWTYARHVRIRGLSAQINDDISKCTRVERLEYIPAMNVGYDRRSIMAPSLRAFFNGHAFPSIHVYLNRRSFTASRMTRTPVIPGIIDVREQIEELKSHIAFPGTAHDVTSIPDCIDCLYLNSSEPVGIQAILGEARLRMKRLLLENYSWGLAESKEVDLIFDFTHLESLEMRNMNYSFLNSLEERHIAKIRHLKINEGPGTYHTLVPMFSKCSVEALELVSAQSWDRLFIDVLQRWNLSHLRILKIHHHNMFTSVQIDQLRRLQMKCPQLSELEIDVEHDSIFIRDQDTLSGNILSKLYNFKLVTSLTLHTVCNVTASGLSKSREDYSERVEVLFDTLRRQKIGSSYQTIIVNLIFRTFETEEQIRAMDPEEPSEDEILASSPRECRMFYLLSDQGSLVTHDYILPVKHDLPIVSII